PFYNPYPYPPTWKLLRKTNAREIHFWEKRQDEWGWDLDHRPYHFEVFHRIRGTFIAGVLRRQKEAKKQWEDEQLARAPPPEPGAISGAGAVEFATADGTKGIPVKMLLASRRALERGLLNPKGRCFEDWPRDTEWVRIQWPAYPDHVPVRSVVISKRVTTKRPRRPITRLELAIELAGLLTQYYSVAISLEPAPAFAHLALGPSEGRISLYGLRVQGIRPAADGIFDLVLELNVDEEGAPPRIVE
ncbi:hypothetical protein C8Q77DRAFT_1033564, partial [Trametes polyzona]